MISRRDAIKSLIMSVGGSSLLSACGGRVTLGSVTPAASRRFYSEREMAVLSRVSDLLLPRTDTPGAIDVGVPGLLDQLMTEWADRETQGEHRTALATLEAELRGRSGGDFLEASHAVAEEALAAVDRADFGGQRVEGYRSLKGLISQAYFATEAGALEELEWVATPGRWEPCVDLS